MAAPEHDRSGGGVRISPQVIVAALLIVALAAFVVQNGHRTPVHWLVFSANLPLWLLLIITCAIAVVAVELISIALRRRGKDKV